MAKTHFKVIAEINFLGESDGEIYDLLLKINEALRDAYAYEKLPAFRIFPATKCEDKSCKICEVERDGKRH